jgi:hypothetical protein
MDSEVGPGSGSGQSLRLEEEQLGELGCILTDHDQLLLVQEPLVDLEAFGLWS